MAENKAKKRRFPLYMTAAQEAEVNRFEDNGYAKSQNEFINKAIEFYIGYLHNEKNIDYIAPILSSVIKSQMQESTLMNSNLWTMTSAKKRLKMLALTLMILNFNEVGLC